eukprot:6184007-Pleurochrysis_carterae.AAC.3
MQYECEAIHVLFTSTHMWTSYEQLAQINRMLAPQSATTFPALLLLAYGKSITKASFFAPRCRKGQRCGKADTSEAFEHEAVGRSGLSPLYLGSGLFTLAAA